VIKLALSGMDIFKLLPRTNCRECQSPSCLAFAMKVAAGKASHRDCPHIDPGSAATLEEMMEPPILRFEIAGGRKRFALGGEKVIYRHEETFYSPTAVGVEIPPGLGEQELKEKAARIKALSFERVGQELSVEMAAIEDPGDGDFARYAGWAGQEGLAVILKTGRPESVEGILSRPRGDGAVLYTTRELFSRHASQMAEAGVIPCLPVRSVQEAEEAGAMFREAGLKKGILGICPDDFGQALEILYRCRLEPLARRNRNLGFPTLIWDPPSPDRLFNAAAAIMKYASIVVIDEDSPGRVLPLLTLRQNIFTDPRRPIQVEAKLYRIGDPGPQSPVLITTNFSLTYFTVSQEIEASRIPAFLLVIDTDGTSVLTAWSADRFSPRIINDWIVKHQVGGLISHGRVVIPGHVAMLKDELEELSGLQVVAGPREAQGIPEFLRKQAQEAGQG